jgi:hypothetical protein
MVTQSNALVLGAINGINGATFDTSVGIGTTAPERKLHVAGPASVEIQIESTDIGGRKWTLQSSSAANGGRFEIIDRTANASRMTILDDGSVGVGTVAPADKLHVNGIVRINTLGAAGATHLCRNASNQISTCSSPRSYGNGDVESIEYERMFNILKEQQEKLESQQKELESQRSVIVQQRSELDGLKAHLCQQTPSAAFCPGSGQK